MEQGFASAATLCIPRLRRKAFQVELLSTTDDEALACILYHRRIGSPMVVGSPNYTALVDFLLGAWAA